MKVLVQNLVNGFKQYRTYVGLLVSAVLLWFTLSRSGISMESFQFNTQTYLLFALAVAIFVLTVGIQAHRTCLIWVSRGMNYFKIHSYSSLIIGNFYNCIMPGNLGEGIRAWHFHRKNKVGLSTSLAAIILEKWIDAQLYITVIVLIVFMHPAVKFNYALLVLCAVAMAILTADLVLLLMVKWKYFRKLCFGILPNRILRLNAYKLYRHFCCHFMNLLKTRWLWPYASIGYFMFACNILQYSFILKAVGIHEPVLSVYSLMIVSCIMIIVSFVPSAPSSAGVVHFGVYTALCSATVALGIEPSKLQLQQFALMSIYLHLSYFLPEIILGLIFLVKEKKWLF